MQNEVLADRRVVEIVEIESRINPRFSFVATSVCVMAIIILPKLKTHLKQQVRSHLTTPKEAGNNLNLNNYKSNVQRIKTIEHISNNGRSAPRSVGAINSIDGKLMPTYVSNQSNSSDDYVVNGEDVTPPPPWAQSAQQL